MTEPLHIEAIVDTAFMVLVIFTCWRVLFGKQATQNVQNPRWKEELAELEKSLGRLIEEAGQASYQLDKNLQRRREELEEVLSKVERKQHQAVEQSTVEAQNVEEPSIEIPNDLPNSTWLEPLKKEPTQNPAPSLDEQIEVATADSPLKSREETLSEKMLAQWIDPVAFKVAKRLLGRGQEIHVVARKLGIPTAQVRLVDSILRRERQDESSEEDVVVQASESESGYSLEDDPLGINIEREVALI